MCACSTKCSILPSIRTILRRTFPRPFYPQGPLYASDRGITPSSGKSVVAHPRHRALMRQPTVSPVEHSSGYWPPTPASQGLRAPTPRPFHGGQGRFQLSLWNPSNRVEPSALPLYPHRPKGHVIAPHGLPRPTVRRLDSASVSPLDDDRGLRPWRRVNGASCAEYPYE